ncbi:aspartoacylase [Vibrio sp. 10N.261.46.E12]|uniref:aspartoacylase n=1 Tax=unclassified Vibrio TaxID=2614977 RepID=UPI0009759F70|nr:MULTISPECIES: aspartoacylase [unclassified Vibrio]OMO37507.1 aspartoacylase [Vibrio sp. 10N.261.45.E1]PMJ27920.1 aspartoacylase [Vibrio sp. 10N.286.45.B6]PML83262.1 aspartoacylase [Vibrio sp. 10N.261.49.E11]PMM74583.1 aspartoacylase [Vibrio sp. 10N.261.46.F12]PMM89728.1 aspartoacylase [Vibrio sp. 10N.261.46.E8]
MDKIKQVLLVAGTHGNELSGIYLNKLIKEGMYGADRSTFSATSVIVNPKAVEQNVRYIDTDLNRQFSVGDKESGSDLAEQAVARQFAERYENREQQLIVDLHNTTSNMGATLILFSNDAFYQKMGAYVKQRMPEANILFEDRKPWGEQPYLCTAGDCGVMIEVGAQAHGSLKFDTLKLMKQMLTLVLDYVENHNLNQVKALQDYSAFFYVEEVNVPLGPDGMRVATVHPAICGRDFEVVKQGEPLLATFFGYDIYWEREQDIYPHFINESAYAKANIAMALAEKRLVSVN